ncbi:MAG: hypothetical protein ACIAQF_01335 [Phycisphaerales bacterium JB065]
MIRSAWLVISTIAIANLLAVLGFVGWLFASDRMDLDRLEELRAMVAPTIAEEQAAAREAEAEAEAERARLEQSGELGAIPISAADRLNIIREMDEVSRQRFERMERETRDLQRHLLAELEAIEKERAAFERIRDAFEQRRAEIAELEQSTQFKRALTLYESSKAEAAANMFQSLIDQGKESDVVSYLNAMKPMNAKKVIEQFEQRDPALAARLLEGVRTYGLSTNE